MSNPPDTTSSTVTAGERLKQAREQAGLSVEKVAKDLYLDARVIHAIEVDHFNELGAPVYAKGYLRKYARLVGVPEEDLLAQYQLSPHATPAPALIPVALGSIPESRQPLPTWVRWLVLLIVIAAGATTLMNLRSSDESTLQGALISRPLLNAEPSPLEGGSQSLPSANDSPLAALPDHPAATNSVNLRFSFSADSWVEVYDARNQQVLHEMGAANSTREITAVPPVRVVLGAADAVQVRVNSQSLEVPPAARQANVAKFVVRADGSLE